MGKTSKIMICSLFSIGIIAYMYISDKLDMLNRYGNGYGPDIKGMITGFIFGKFIIIAIIIVVIFAMIFNNQE
jgi:hypothetical protein